MQIEELGVQEVLKFKSTIFKHELIKLLFIDYR